MPKHILWDFDGTLAFREGMWTGALMEAVRRSLPDHHVGVQPLADEHFRSFIQSGYRWHEPHRSHLINSADEWWAELIPVFERAFIGVGLSEPQARELARGVRAIYTDPKFWKLYADTIPTLRELSRQGWTHAVLSNHVPELPFLIDGLGLGGIFSHVFNSAETGYEKPHAAAFRLALNGLGQTDAIWMIGDNPVADIAGAEGAGIPAILVHRPGVEAKHRCDQLAGVPDLLRRLTGSAADSE